MDLATQYQRQYRWRSWKQAYELLPPVAGARVLDLGCAIGDQSHDLAALGARVVGVDGNEQLLAHARERAIPDAVFELGDIRSPSVEGPFDGIWASFVAAYFPDLPSVLAKWRDLLRPGGWIALTEVAGLFRHEPVSVETRALFDAYMRESQEVGRYDFDMGSKLAGFLESSGFEVETCRILPDRELSFSGPADADVLEAWAERLGRMRLLQEAARHAYPSFQEDFLRCLISPGHRTECRVHFCVARRV